MMACALSAVVGALVAIALLLWVLHCTISR